MGRVSTQTCLGPGDSGKGCHNSSQFQCRTCERTLSVACLKSTVGRIIYFIFLDEPTFCDSCLHITHKSFSSNHKLAECISGRWRPLNLVVNYNLPKQPKSAPPHRYKRLVAWTMSGSTTIGVDYKVTEGTSEVVALFQRLLELGYVPATPAQPGMLAEHL